MSPLRWGVLGLGRAGQARARAIQQDPRAELLAGHRGDPSALGVPDWPVAEILARCDVVAVCSPDPLHPEQVHAALMADCHVLCEFPLAHSLAQAQALMDLAAERGRVLHTEHIELLGGVSRALASAELRPASGVLSFESGPTAYPVVWANVARLHRAVHALGLPQAVRVETRSPSLLTGALIYPWGELGLHFSHRAGQKRSTRMVLAGAQTWVHQDRTLSRDGTPVSLPQGPGLFVQDQRAASARILDGAPPYVSDSRILAVLELAQRLDAAPCQAAE